MSNNRFTIERSVERKNGWACKDNENGAVCVFDDKKFNETQNTVLLEDIEPNVLLLARISREMADWLLANHKDKLY